LLVGSGATWTAEAADGGPTNTADERLRVLDADDPADHDRLRLHDGIDDDESDYLGSDDHLGRDDDRRRDIDCSRHDDERRRDYDRAGGDSTDDVGHGHHRCCDHDNHRGRRCRHHGSDHAEDAAQDTAARGSQGRPHYEDDAENGAAHVCRRHSPDLHALMPGTDKRRCHQTTRSRTVLHPHANENTFRSKGALPCTST
jgi:hypothetical protein